MDYQYLQDADVSEVDPFAECREAIAELQSDWKNYSRLVKEWTSAGWSPAYVQQAMIELNQGNKNVPPSFCEQIATPAFLRYLAGVMGAV